MEKKTDSVFVGFYVTWSSLAVTVVALVEIHEEATPAIVAVEES